MHVAYAGAYEAGPPCRPAWTRIWRHSVTVERGGVQCPGCGPSGCQLDHLGLGECDRRGRVALAEAFYADMPTLDGLRRLSVLPTAAPTASPAIKHSPTTPWIVTFVSLAGKAAPCKAFDDDRYVYDSWVG